MTLNQRTGALLRAARHRAGLRLEDVAPLLPGMGLGRNNLSRLEQGAIQWTSAKIEAVCGLYGVEPREVLG